MKQLIKVPSAGESVTQATIGEWQKKDGSYVHQNDVLVVMETDKASMDLTAEASGRLKILKPEGVDVAIGEVIAELDTSAPPPADNASSKSSSPAKPSAADKSAANKSAADKFAADKSAAHHSVENKESPAVRKLITEHGLKPSDISGTGPKGNIIKKDVLDFIKAGAGAQSTEEDLPVGSKGFAMPSKILTSAGQIKTDPKAKQPPAPLQPIVPSTAEGPQQTRKPMSTIRRRIAERLVESQKSTATLTTFNEVDMSKVIKLRTEYKQAFIEKHQVKLGFMGFFIKAVTKALQAFPRVNAFIEGKEIVYNQACHIGVAVSTDKGLVVPVIKNAESLSLPDLEKNLLFYAQKARDGKIHPNDLMGGTFTISNGGVFGSLMSTPILNPPQSGILGMHKIEQRPIAIEGQVQIRPMMYTALSYDHRIVDGKESVSFLLKVKECVEDPFRLLMDV